jgi:cellulose synthase (UDP-forming)
MATTGREGADALLTSSTRGRARLMAFAFIPLSISYFAWLLHPERVGHPVLYAILVITELFNFAQALGFWWTCAHDHIDRLKDGCLSRDTAVDVLIPVCGEPLDVVEPTVAAARRMRGAELRVALLDDGDSAEIKELARRHGVAYIRRSSHTGAKAGNLNHALRLTCAPFVTVFDCDHVPDRRFLQATLPHFADERVGFVQTPQYYANAPVAGGVCAAAWTQQALFFGPISRGKDALGGMFCCGTNMVLRRSALGQIGGFPESSLTEDFEMSITLHERGYRSVYIPRVLARGLGPEDMASYVSQQHRWARGCLSALPKILKAHIPWRLRVQYLLSAMYFLTGWSVLVYVTLPIIRLLTGAQPLGEATADQFLLHFAPYFGMALMAVALFGRGLYSYDGYALMSAAFWVHVRALVGLLLRRPSRFTVTPKKGTGTRQPRAVAPTLLAVGVLLASACFGLLQDREPATWNNVAFALVHSAVLTSGAWPAVTRARNRPAADPRIQDERRQPAEGPAPASPASIGAESL